MVRRWGRRRRWRANNINIPEHNYNSDTFLRNYIKNPPHYYYYGVCDQPNGMAETRTVYISVY